MFLFPICTTNYISIGKDIKNIQVFFLFRRARVESSAAPRTKACREKLRRDRLNDRYNDRCNYMRLPDCWWMMLLWTLVRFRELCCVLDPGKPPKADKLAVLRDATHLLIQLRVEAKKLKESNEALQDAIKNLKVKLSSHLSLLSCCCYQKGWDWIAGGEIGTEGWEDEAEVWEGADGANA